jgi:hypothetical protein
MTAKLTAQDKESVVKAAFLEELKDRIRRFYQNEITDDSPTADKHLRNSLTELGRAFDESVQIVEESFPS